MIVGGLIIVDAGGSANPASVDANQGEGDVRVGEDGAIVGRAAIAVDVTATCIEGGVETGVELRLAGDGEFAGERAQKQVGYEVLRAKTRRRPGVGENDDVAAIEGGGAPVLMEAVAGEIGGVGGGRGEECEDLG